MSFAIFIIKQFLHKNKITALDSQFLFLYFSSKYRVSQLITYPQSSAPSAHSFYIFCTSKNRNLKSGLTVFISYIDKTQKFYFISCWESSPQTDIFHPEDTFTEMFTENVLAGKLCEISVFHPALVLSSWFSCIESSNISNMSLLLEFFFQNPCCFFNEFWLYFLSNII